MKSINSVAGMPAKSIYKKAITLMAMLLCLTTGKTFAQYYNATVTGAEVVAQGSTNVYTLNNAPTGTYVTWTPTNGTIVGSSSGLNLFYTYVYWSPTLNTGVINATLIYPNNFITSINLYVRKWTPLADLPGKKNKKLLDPDQREGFIFLAEVVEDKTTATTTKY